MRTDSSRTTRKSNSSDRFRIISFRVTENHKGGGTSMSLQDLSFPMEVSWKLIAKSRHLVACAANPFPNARWRSSVSVFACIFLFGLAAAPSARADGTCSAFLAAKLKEAQSKKHRKSVEQSMNVDVVERVIISARSL